MSRRGKTPTLISGQAGCCKFVTAKIKRTCKRCDEGILKGERCIEVTNPTNWGRKTYCASCFSEIIDQTRQDLDRLRQQLRTAQ